MRKVALGLCNTCLIRKSIEVVRYDIENLIKLSQRFGETAARAEVNRTLCEKRNAAWIEALGFGKVRFALVPLAPPSRDIGQRFRNPAAIRQKLTRLLKVTHRRVVIFQACVVVISLG
jgi:hypothetical protein